VRRLATDKNMRVVGAKLRARIRILKAMANIYFG